MGISLFFILQAENDAPFPVEERRGRGRCHMQCVPHRPLSLMSASDLDTNLSQLLSTSLAIVRFRRPQDVTKLDCPLRAIRTWLTVTVRVVLVQTGNAPLERGLLPLAP